MESKGIPPDPSEAVPAWDPKVVLRVGGAGAALAAVAAALALAARGSEALQGGSFDAARLLCAFLGVLTAGVGVWLRPGLAGAWLLAAAAAGLAYAGVPDDWDSAWMVAGVFALFCLGAAAVLQLSTEKRLAVISALVLVHFVGILTAVTSPPPQPWLTHQTWVLVYRPYLQFMYLNNAYQFYSPDPGPAMQVWACVKYNSADPDERYEWYKFPLRPRDYKDPLALSYYRRLSVTEQLNQALQTTVMPTREDLEARRRRLMPHVGIPFLPGLPEAQQYRPPNNECRQLTLPSYARHIARLMARPGREVESVKIYRVEHRILSPREFTQVPHPDYEATFYPYFQGEFDPEGNLINPKDPMLYWLVPFVPRQGGSYASQGGDAGTAEVEDYLSKHAGAKHNR